MGAVKKLLHPITAVMPCGPHSRVDAISMISGDNHQMVIRMATDLLIPALVAWRSGSDLVQNCFPALTADEREFLQSGITSAEWDEMYAEDEARANQERLR